MLVDGLLVELLVLPLKQGSTDTKRGLLDAKEKGRYVDLDKFGTNWRVEQINK